jgi:hypothetical protein
MAERLLTIGANGAPMQGIDIACFFQRLCWRKTSGFTAVMFQVAHGSKAEVLILYEYHHL